MEQYVSLYFLQDGWWLTVVVRITLALKHLFIKINDSTQQTRISIGKLNFYEENCFFLMLVTVQSVSHKLQNFFTSLQPVLQSTANRWCPALPKKDFLMLPLYLGYANILHLFLLVSHDLEWVLYRPFGNKYNPSALSGQLHRAKRQPPDHHYRLKSYSGTTIPTYLNIITPTYEECFIVEKCPYFGSTHKQFAISGGTVWQCKHSGLSPAISG